MEDSKITNFEAITKSPETLAKFLDELSTACTGSSECYNCPIDDYCNFDNGESILRYLKEEYNES